MKPANLRLLLAAVALFPFSCLSADEPALRQLIDQRLVPVAAVQPDVCSDADFLRRVSLDLIGMPPTADEARAFLADSAPNKRQLLVDRLLESPHYARHMASTLDLMLMERRGNTHVPADQWQGWLLQSVRENKPWNVLAREILSADGADPATRPAARFALDRGSDPHLLTRDIGRIFFGRDLQCAQCHDHPLVDDYLQSDYHGLLAFVSPSYAQVIKQGDKEQTVRAERAGVDVSFESVFLKGTPHRTGARMPGRVALEEPYFLPGEEYEVAPADNTKSVPKFSRRARLAELATDGSNAPFNANIVNRLWAHMFGRGLVHPLDLHHADNPAADPELLRALADRFAAMNFDIKAFLRELALSSAYQRPFDPPGDLLAVAGQAQQQAAALQQQIAVLETQAQQSTQAYGQATEAWHSAESAALPVAGEVDGARNQYAESKKKLDEANKALADATAQLQAKQQVAMPVQQAAASARQAAEALPDDQELAGVVQQLAAKSQQLAAEVAPLAKAVEEKTAAAKAPAESAAQAKPPLQAALDKLAPLSAAAREAEQQMLAARQQAAAASGALIAAGRRLATAEKIGELAELQQALAAAQQQRQDLQSQLAAAQQQLEQAQTADDEQRQRLQQAVQQAGEAVAAGESQQSEKQAALNAAVEAIPQRLAADFTISSLKPLTPEQLCWSVFRVTGVYDRYWQAEVAELDKAQPLSDEQKQDAAVMAARQAELEQRTFDKLKGNVGTFVTFYGAAAGQPQGDFFATADQALFAANGGSINSWVAPAADNVTDRVVKQADLKVAAEELYLGVLTRLPTAEESAEIESYLNARSADKAVAAQELVWALLNSAEFRFNH